MSDVRSPPPSSEQFDALIELLATDDARDDSNFHIVPEGTASNGLRDAEGKLDYAKIRSLFLQRQANDNDNDNDIVPFDQLHSEPNSGTKLPQIVVEEPTALAEGPILTEPLPKQRDTESNEIEAVQKNGDVHSSPSVLTSEASLDSLVQHLQDALSMAKEEVVRLQQQVLNLQTQATKLLETNAPQDASDTRGCLVNSAKPATLTLHNVQDAFATGTSALTTLTNIDRPDWERAMQFLIRVDELVWRRSRYPNGPTAPVFSQGNVDALTERLTLWENIVRAPAP